MKLHLSTKNSSLISFFNNIFENGFIFSYFIRLIAKDKFWNFIHLCTFSPPPCSSCFRLRARSHGDHHPPSQGRWRGRLHGRCLWRWDSQLWDVFSRYRSSVVMARPFCLCCANWVLLSFFKRHKPLLPKSRSWSGSGRNFNWLHKAGAAEGCSEAQHQGRSREQMIRTKNEKQSAELSVLVSCYRPCLFLSANSKQAVCNTPPALLITCKTPVRKLECIWLINHSTHVVVVISFLSYS